MVFVFQSFSVAEKTGTIRPQAALDPKGIFENDVLDKLKNGERIVNSSYSLQYDKEFNVIRLQNYKDPLNSVAINFWLNDDGKIREISSVGKDSRSGLVVPLIEVEGIFLKKYAIATLGIDENERNQVTADAEKSKSLAIEFGSLNGMNLQELSSSYQYSGKNTKGVIQGSAAIIKPEGKTDGLYTFGAGPCSVVIAVSRDFSGKIIAVGMAHVDALTETNSIARFLNMVKGTGPNDLEVSIISGEANTALKIYELARQEKIAFLNCDLDGQRSDAVTVGKDGTIYYGDRPNFNNNQKMFNPAALQQVAMKMTPMPLAIKIEE